MGRGCAARLECYLNEKRRSKGAKEVNQPMTLEEPTYDKMNDALADHGRPRARGLVEAFAARTLGRDAGALLGLVPATGSGKPGQSD
jgi:hypothetical protein